MKILILSWEIYPIYCGGLGVLVRHLVNELQAQGHEVSTAVPDSTVLVEDKKILILKDEIEKQLLNLKPIDGLDFKLKNFNLKAFKKVDTQVTKVYPNNTPTVAQAYAYAIEEHLKTNNYDVILGMDWLSIPTFQLLKNINCPIPFSFYINGTEVDRNYGGKMSKTSVIIHNLEKKFYNQADKIYTVSSVSKKVLIKYLNCKAKQIIIIHNDSEMKSIVNLEQPREDKRILFLGRLVYQKGLRYLMMAFRKLLKLDSAAKLSIVGDGEELKMINKYIAKHNLHNYVTLVNWLDGEEKRLAYANASLFVMPSVSEPFGLTALEAIRQGVPTIASTRCGFTDIVPSTPTFEYRDTKLFSQLMYRLINSKENSDDLIKIQKKELNSHNWVLQVEKLINSIQ